MRKLLAALAISALVLTTSACANDSLADQFRSGDNKNYIAGDGTVTEFALGSRPKAASWSGVTESGEAISSTQLEGVITVMNFWYAGCAPCRIEMPELIELQTEFLPEGVQFIGVNVRDSAETSLAFARRIDMNFPSVMDAKTGSVVLGFTGVVTPQAVPTTLVIDAEGNVSARVLGRIDKGILTTLVKTVIEERK
ncbi:MAG: TlpA disulfide reductase family protein [Micrococcales bacterium]|nr:TlpA disulfide reductase family protein [Micrococcales bacterium]